MNCPQCNGKLKKVSVAVSGAASKVISYQCTKCDYSSFDPATSKKVIEELRETPLKIKQKVIKLSGDRLGIYFGRDIVRSLKLKKGEDLYVSIPDKNHIILELKN